MKAQTIGALRASGYEVKSIRQEMRNNLIEKIRRNDALFPGIIGYEDRVIPGMENAILSGHHIIMEERDVQVRGYKIRLPLDVFVVATANPEDYTNRGRIITPLKDRFGAEVRTHYPKSADLELAIVEQERTKIEHSNIRLTVPFF